MGELCIRVWLSGSYIPLQRHCTSLSGFFSSFKVLCFEFVVIAPCGNKRSYLFNLSSLKKCPSRIVSSMAGSVWRDEVLTASKWSRNIDGTIDMPAAD